MHVMIKYSLEAIQITLHNTSFCWRLFVETSTNNSKILHSLVNSWGPLIKYQILLQAFPGKSTRRTPTKTIALIKLLPLRITSLGIISPKRIAIWNFNSQQIPPKNCPQSDVLIFPWNWEMNNHLFENIILFENMAVK